MASGHFIMDHHGFAEMAVGPEIAAAVKAEAERAKAIAEGLSTYFIVTSEYIDSFEVAVEVQELPSAGRSPAHAAAVGILRNLSGHAVGVEYGYRGRSDAPTKKAHRVLGRTLAALGGS